MQISALALSVLALATAQLAAAEGAGVHVSRVRRIPSCSWCPAVPVYSGVLNLESVLGVADNTAEYEKAFGPYISSGDQFCHYTW